MALFWSHRKIGRNRDRALARGLCPVGKKAIQELSSLVLRLISQVAWPEEATCQGLLPQKFVISTFCGISDCVRELEI